MCSALYCVIFVRIPSDALRPLVRGRAFRCALPNQFRCQTSKPSCLTKKARTEAVGNLPEQSRKTGGLSPDRRHLSGGGDQETVNESGGAERDRTADLMLAKHALSQLSYSPKCGRLWQRWWAWVESNYRPHPYQGCALTN